MKLIYKLSIATITYFTIILTFGTKNSELLAVFLSLSLMFPIIYLISDRFKQKNKIAMLQEETLKAELNLLKSQINPHFFFNTLNNLYGLAVEKSDKTQDVIYKLSEMMRFTIYDGRKNSVSIQGEINYLENFIELHKIRYNHDVDIQFEKEIEDEEQTIPPLLFINLLENAFKHGLDTQLTKGYIKFKLKTTKTRIIFDIENNVDLTAKKKSSGSIGIENLKRRLELLFPNKHQFITELNDDIYTVHVTIELD